MSNNSPEKSTVEAVPVSRDGDQPGRIKTAAGRVRRFLMQDVWDIEPLSLPRLHRSFVRAVRVVQLVFRGFMQDECMLHASSLTFTTLLAIVPVLALALSMARVFGGDDLARNQLKGLAREWLDVSVQVAPVSEEQTDTVPAVTVSEEEVAEQVEPEFEGAVVPGEAVISLERIENLIDTAFDRIDKLNFKALGGLGLIFLISAVIGMLGQVEAAFNRVWGVSEHRQMHRKFIDYLSVLIVVPFLITAASSIPIAGVVMRFVRGEGVPLEIPATWIRLLRTLGMIFLFALSFSFLLRFLPNTRVRSRPGILGGLATALLSLGWLRICAAFQIGVARNSAFFGSFATLPVLLSWVYVSWMILLFGAEVSFATQNADTYRMEQGARKASQRTRLIAAIDLMVWAAHSLKEGNGLLVLGDYLKENSVSVRLVNDVLHDLVRQKYLVETAHDSGIFALRRDISSLTVGEIVRTMLDSGLEPGHLGYDCVSHSRLCDPLDAALQKLLPQRLADLSN